MRFLHTADLHLDSAFCACGAKDAQSQREEGRQLLCRVFECAQSEGCEMIVIAGDLFDSKFVSPESAELFCSLVEQCSMPVVLAPGNHDPYFENSFYSKAAERLGEKLLLFTTPELQVLDIDRLGVRIYGYAFTSGVLPVSPLADADAPQDNGYLKIFCGHAELDSPLSRYAPIMLSELERFGFAYSALGHVHNCREHEDVEGRVRYSGFAEGRAFDELGEGGVWIVDVDEEKCICERKILSRKAFYVLDAELSAEDDHGEIESKIRGCVQRSGCGGNSYVRLVLSGMADDAELGLVLRTSEEIKKSLGLAYLELIDETMPLLDRDYLERDATLRGELYRTLRPKLMSEDPSERALALRALKIGLAAIDGKNIFGVAD